MKRKLSEICKSPLHMYPYAVLAVIVLGFAAAILIMLIGLSDYSIVAIFAAAALIVLIHLTVFVYTIINAVRLSRTRMTAYEAALYNSELKRYHLPTHLINSIIATFGILLSVWGIPFFLIAILISCSAVFFTGITAAVCIIKIRKQKAITLTEAILYTTGSFILLIDHVAAGNLLYQIQRQTFGY